MFRFKIFRKPTFLIFTFSLLTLSVGRSVETPYQGATISINNLEKAPINQKEINIYKANQQALHEALTQYFEKAIASGDIVGAGVSIVKGDSIVISGGFGKRNVRLDDKVDAETVFRLGSLSKRLCRRVGSQIKK